ncbi:hypothetical protein PoB_001295700 [Plakobranchus ocellatus]|uniref:Uncharacterized protein n=1 Tax=Plakobranchus ocellatus TaxID=259542 RepID=A0AAV3YWA3_9GAST|nr:hypothetical protein PoB_001295700 [Plakobranchus ocellatus]
MKRVKKVRCRQDYDDNRKTWYLGISLNSRLCLRRYIEEVANSAKDNDSTEAGGDKLGRQAPVPENDLHQLHTTGARVCKLGALRSIPIVILELAARCEPLALRRDEQTVLPQEMHLRIGECAPLRSIVEEFATQHRRITKGASSQRGPRPLSKLQRAHRSGTAPCPIVGPRGDVHPS